ncbi:MAG: hypothetical protein ACSHX3_05760 [Litorimonas sp.]
MTPIPSWSLPTDNLYKFIALSGLALVIVPVILFYIEVGSITSLQPDFNSKMRHIESLKKLMEERLNSGTLTGEEINFFHEISITLNDVLTVVDHQKARLPMMLTLGVISIVGLFIGYAMMWFGFKNWCLKVQKPLDNILRLEVELIKSKAREVVEDE